MSGLVRRRRSLEEILRAGRTRTGLHISDDDIHELRGFPQGQTERAMGFEEEEADGSGTSQNANWIPELPMDLRRQVHYDQTMPEADFVPDTVTDPALRKILKGEIIRKQQEQIFLRRSEGQWGGQLSNIVPPGSPLLVANFIPGTNQPIGTQNYTTGGSVLQWSSSANHPEAVNVTLGQSLDDRNTPGQSLDTDDVSLYFKAEWGGGSGQMMAFGDFGQGTQLRLTASYVRISALYLPNNLPTGWPTQPVPFLEGGATPTGPTLTASALLGLGFPTFRTSSARFTRKFTLASGSPGSPGTIFGPDPIPLFASAFGLAFLSATGDGTAPIDVSIFLNTQTTGNLAAGAGSTYGFNVTDPAASLMDNHYMIPQGCRFITVVNNGDSDLSCAIVYSLLL